ncbi:MAG: FAD-binding oxidoreductase [Cetobacterium sp.]
MTVYKSKVKEIKQIHKEVLELTLSLPSEYDFKVVPGQFIVIKFEGFNRAYSVLEYDIINNELKLAIQRVENGKATTIIFNEYKIGTEINITKPMGNKLIVDKSHNDIMLVATGIGIVPIYCILKDLAANYNCKVDLIYGTRYKEDLYYLDDILNMTKDNISFTPVLSREDIPGVHRGYITDIITKENTQGKKIYMCSSNTVAKSFKEKLESINFDMNNFKHESN